MTNTNSGTLRRFLAALGLSAGMLAVALLAAGFSTGAAQAASTSAKGTDVLTTPAPTPTPRPIRLRPWLQFGHALPGDNAHYRQLLFNHLSQDTSVTLWGDSLRG